MRRKSRESAFKIIYSSLFKNEVEPEIVLAEENLSEDEIQYANLIVNTYFQNKINLTENLKNILKGYDYNRVYKIDLALIILATVENLYLEVPKAVAINEILEICKIYSTEKSPSFVNGILKDLLK